MTHGPHGSDSSVPGRLRQAAKSARRGDRPHHHSRRNGLGEIYSRTDLARWIYGLPPFLCATLFSVNRGRERESRHGGKLGALRHYHREGVVRAATIDCAHTPSEGPWAVSGSFVGSPWGFSSSISGVCDDRRAAISRRTSTTPHNYVSPRIGLVTAPEGAPGRKESGPNLGKGASTTS